MTAVSFRFLKLSPSISLQDVDFSAENVACHLSQAPLDIGSEVTLSRGDGGLFGLSSFAVQPRQLRLLCDRRVGLHPPDAQENGVGPVRTTAA